MRVRPWASHKATHSLKRVERGAHPADGVGRIGKPADRARLPRDVAERVRAGQRDLVGRAARRDVAAREMHVAARVVELRQLPRQPMRAGDRLGLRERRQRRVESWR